MEEEGTIKISTFGIKNNFAKTKDFFKQKKVFYAVIIIFLISIVFLSTWIRTQNIPQLKDITTNEYTLGPDLDPFLYLRLAHEIIDTGELQNPDYMRYHGAKTYYNFLPYGIAYLYKILSIFNPSTSLEYAAIIFPVIFFGASIIVFFFFVRKVFNKRSILQKNTIAGLSTALYAITPLMLHRTVAGIPELESAGLFFFWSSFLLFLHAWEGGKENQGKIFNRKNLLALLSGIATSFMIFTWGGSKFILMSLPLAVLIAFIFGKVKKQETITYSLWFLPSIIFLVVKSGIFSVIELTNGFAPTFVFFVLIFGIFLKSNWEEKIKRTIKMDWAPKEIITLILVLFSGMLVLLIIKPEYVIGLIGTIKEGLLYPFGRARVGITVAENAKPYVVDWLSQFGKGFFWLFFFGTIFLFNSAIEHLHKKERIILNLSFIIFIFGFVFSRYSASSTFNGDNFISQVVYFGSLFLLLFSLAYVYIKRSKQKDFSGLFEIDFSHIFILSLIILMIIASRGAIRLFVISSPVFIIAAGFLPVALLSHWAKSKDDLLRLILLILLISSLVVFSSTFINYEKTTKVSAQYSAPSPYNMQWQQAMAWVRNTTPIDSIFVHWWDYGYWVQTLGERPTVTDGGHEIIYWDHLVGRYVLTEKNPNAALSFMKTHNVSYLLIDSSDLGKYPAYSSIGSDSKGEDRFSQIPIMIVDPSQTVETSNGEKRVYQGGTTVDEDIVYSDGNGSFFLPSGKSFIIGVILDVSQEQDSATFKQPIAVFLYNNQQVRIPMRYLYYKGQIVDFKTGIEATARVMQKGDINGQSVSLDELGSVIYLSPHVSDGLFAQLYLMNDPYKKYPTVTLAHSESDFFVAQLRSQGLGIEDIVYFQGFRGPINIWEIKYPANILEREEFLRTSGGYGEFDNLQFTI